MKNRNMINKKFHINIREMSEIIVGSILTVCMGDVYFFKNTSFLCDIYMQILMLCFAIIFLYVIINRSSFSKYGLIMLSAEVIVMISTIYQGRLNSLYAKMWLSEFLLAAWVDLCIRKKPLIVIKSISYGTVILLYWNMINLIVVDNNNYLTTLVGHKNYNTYLFVITLGFYYLKRVMIEKKILSPFTFVTYIIFFFAMKKYDSASMKLGVFFFSLFIFVLCYIKPNIYKFKYFIVAYLLIEIFIIYVLQSSIVQLILLYLGRDVTLTGRADMWIAAISAFQEHPIFGGGYLNQIRAYDVYNGWHDNNCHNYLLNIISSGGIIYSLLYGMIYLKIIKVLDGVKNNDKKLLFGATLCSMLMAVLIMGFTETIIVTNSLFLPLLMICINYDKIRYT